MALAGNIKEFGLADIFQIVSLQQKTGTLTVKGAEGTVIIFVENGFIVGGDASFRPIAERLEQALVRSQNVSKFHMKRAIDSQKKTAFPLWTILSALDGVDKHIVQQAISQQIHETVYHVLRWADGEFQFDPLKTVEYDRELISPINTEFLVMEGFRITDEWSEIEKSIPSLQMIIRRTANGANELSDMERKVYHLIEGECSIQETIDMSQLGEFDVCQTIYELLKKQVIEPVAVSGKKGETPKVKVRQRPSINIKDIGTRAITILATAGILAGVVFLFTILPENFLLLHKPGIRGTETVKQFVAQSQLQYMSRAVLLSFLEQNKIPASFDELRKQGQISSGSSPKDPWGHEYVITTDKNRVSVRSLGKDGALNTDDDVTVIVPLK